MKKITRYIDRLTNRTIRNGPAQTRTHHQVDDQVTLSPPYSSTAVPSSSSPMCQHPGSSTPTDSRSKGALISHESRQIGKKSTNERRCLVDILHDDALLAIFDHFISQCGFEKDLVEEWQTLVHVCRRWRSIVFGSPRRLNLRLICTATTPARDRLDVWPVLPLGIYGHWWYNAPKEWVDNFLVALERSNRIYQIRLEDIQSSDLEKVLTAMQVPFPELDYLRLTSFEKTERVISDSFLGGSAPRLGHLYFLGIPFPGLPNLLLSTPHLVSLRLDDIPHSGYFSPEAIVAALSTLNSLGELWLKFQSPRSSPDRRPPPPIRSIHPALVEFHFEGASEYLEDLVARISAPRLGRLRITFFNQIIFNTPQFIQFISRTPTLKAPKMARIFLTNVASSVNFSETPCYIHRERREVIPCIDLDWQVSSLQQVFTSCLPHLSTLEGLSINCPRRWLSDWQDNIEDTLWLELLLPFTTVKNLYLFEEVAQRVVPALQELVESGNTEVLSALENIFLEGLEPLGPIEKGIGQFVAMRQITGHHIAVTRWDGFF